MPTVVAICGCKHIARHADVQQFHQVVNRLGDLAALGIDDRFPAASVDLYDVVDDLFICAGLGHVDHGAKVDAIDAAVEPLDGHGALMEVLFGGRW